MSIESEDEAFLAATTPDERAAALGLDWPSVLGTGRRIQRFGGLIVLGGAVLATAVGAVTQPSTGFPLQPMLIGIAAGLIATLAAIIVTSLVARRWTARTAQLWGTGVAWVVFVWFTAASLTSVQGNEWIFVAGTLFGGIAETVTHSSLGTAFTRGGASMLRGVRLNLEGSAFVPSFGAPLAWYLVAFAAGLVSRGALVGILDNEPGVIPVWIVLVPVIALVEVIAAARRAYRAAAAVSIALAVSLVVLAAVLSGTP